MIVETLPAVQSLTLENKLLLAAELFEVATDCSAEEADPKVVEALDRRLAEYRDNPASASPWSAVKARILGSGAS
jgi:putative addiction module component (TIGR02574 family)